MRVPGFLDGAIDLHVHSSPDVDARRYDDIDLAREAVRAGMSAILIKSHQNSTVERAILAAKIVPEIQIFGGLVLNDTVGGLNPHAVELALALGAKQIWMPTRSARNHRQALKLGDGGISILDGEGSLLPAVTHILDLIARTDCVLGTGHLSPAESVKLIGAAHEKGVRRILITHPEWRVTFFPITLQQELSAIGSVHFERCYVSTTHRCGYTPMETIAGAIASVGVGTTILSSDLGQDDTPPPAEGMIHFAEQLSAHGFSHDDLHRMMAANPALLLGLNGRQA